MQEVRTRFAPSPTGPLHLGGARTALFNYLFARHAGGKVVLRVEDTDQARSTAEFEEAQLAELDWLGLRFDEGPYRQSERGESYEEAMGRLREVGLVYEAQDEAGRRAQYFRPPERSGRVRDGLRGDVRFSRIEDFVVRKSDGTPSYNFAAVVDDGEMGITHVIRGEEHLPNTGRQALLYRALDLPEPEFIHLGLILGSDGKKLSKRHGAASVAEYRESGFLPEALIGYLALLGWTHPQGNEEFGDLDELVHEWDPSRLGASPATFDLERLLYLNARRIRSLSVEDLLRRIQPFLREPLPDGKELLTVGAIRDEMRVLSDAPRLTREILGPVDPTTMGERLPNSTAMVFSRIVGMLENRKFVDVEAARTFVAELRAWAKGEGIKTRDLLHPLRLALTGRDRGPEMAHLFAVLGPEEARRRIEAAREAILRA